VADAQLQLIYVHTSLWPNIRAEFSAADKINILAQVDAHIGTNVEQASWLRLSVPTLHPNVKNHEETERSFIHC
jgi:hypothetical protein